MAQHGAKTIHKPGATKRRKSPRRPEVFPSTRQIATIMFIDIVGFSLRGESEAPEGSFRHLRAILHSVSAMIKEYGGIVDRTLGDGLLCYFTKKDHAFRALSCAVDIQRKTLRKSLEPRQSPYNPLRIGINTAPVFIGNLGTPKKRDITLIGAGVNLAKRFETACESYRILIGLSTREALGDKLKKFPLVRRFVQIKHRVDLHETFECDPFQDAPELVAEARQRFWKTVHLAPESIRHTVPADKHIEVLSQIGKGRLLNFSETGIALEFDTYLAPGLVFLLHVSPLSKIGKNLTEKGINPLIAEVRWGKPEGQKYRLGLALKNLTPDQRILWIAELRPVVK